MIQLRLLGALELTGPEGSSVLSVLSQPKRMGLLAYLVAAHPHGFHSRDKLLAIFWPESDAEHARNALRQSLHFLRRSLGEGAIASRGEEVAADLAQFDCDVLALDEAVEREDWRAAVELYRGPLMEGFHVTGAPEFDRWLEEERERIRALAVRSGEELSSECEAAGDLSGAVEMARWGVHLSPASGRAAKRLIELLGRSGDRAGAIESYETFKNRLAEDFGLEPSEDVEAAVEGIRRGEEVVRPSGGEGKPEVRGADESPSEDTFQEAPKSSTQPKPPVLDAGLSSRLRSRDRSSHPGLTRPRVLLAFVTIVAALGLLWAARELILPPQRTPVFLRPPAGMRPDNPGGTLAEDLMEEVELALENSQSVRPELSRPTWDYLLETRFSSDSVIFTLSPYVLNAGPLAEWAYDLAGIQGSIDLSTVATDLVGNLERQVVGRSDIPLRLRGTGTVAAANAFNRGRRLWDLRDPKVFEEAIGLLQEAVTQDTLYALAYAALADVYNLLGAYDYGGLPPDRAQGLASSFGETAVRLDGELAQALAARAATRFFYDWDFESAREGFLEAIERDNGYAHSRHWLGLLEVAEGRFEEALHQLNQALDSDRSQVFHAARARVLYFSGRYRESIRGYEMALEQDVDFIPALLGKGLSALMADDWETARREYASAANLLGDRGAIAWALQGHLFGREGNTAGANEMLRRLEEAQQQPNVYIPPEYFAMVHLGLEEYDEALLDLEQAFENGSNSMTILKIDPLLEPVRDHLRYQDLVARVDSIKAEGGRGH